MGAATGYVYRKALSRLANSEIDFDTDTIKVALLATGYTPDQDAHDYFDDITNELSTANGYTAGGATLGTKNVDETTTKKVVFDAANTVWTASGGSIGPATHAIVYKDTGTASTSPLISYIVFAGAETATDGNTFTVTWDATNGVFAGTVA